jgi:hypothetical protein
MGLVALFSLSLALDSSHLASGKSLMYLLLSHLGRISRICAIERQIELVHLFIYVVDITFPSRWQKGGGTPSVNSTARHYPNPSLRNSLCCLW